MCQWLERVLWEALSAYEWAGVWGTQLVAGLAVLLVVRTVAPLAAVWVAWWVELLEALSVTELLPPCTQPL